MKPAMAKGISGDATCILSCDDLYRRTERKGVERFEMDIKTRNHGKATVCLRGMSEGV